MKHVNPVKRSPRISILLPVLNGAATLEPCLRSVLRQSVPDWECWVVDDGSTDATAEIVAGFARRDARIELISRPWEGLVSSLNAGLDRCRGAFVARMDADDVMHGDRLRAQSEVLEAQPGLAAVGCHVRLFPRQGLAAGSRDYEAWINDIDYEGRVHTEAFVECPIAHPTLMMRRERLNTLRYRDRGWPEDYDLILRALAAGDRIGVVPRRLLGWRQHPAKLSRTSETYSIERFTACKAHFLANGFLGKDARYLLWGHGGTGRALRRELKRHGKAPSHIIEVHPGRLGNRIDDALVVPPEQLPELPRHPLVVSVAGAGPRAEIRERLATMGFDEGTDFVCAA